MDSPAADEQHYSLRWSEFHDNMIHSFRELQKHADFVDVTIAADSYSVQAHKLVLSACSPYFSKLLKSNPCQHPVVILQNVTSKSLEYLMTFMYNGEVQVSHEHLSDFLRTAEMLQVKGLSETSVKPEPNSRPPSINSGDSSSCKVFTSGSSLERCSSPALKRTRYSDGLPQLPPSITAIPTSGHHLHPSRLPSEPCSLLAAAVAGGAAAALREDPDADEPRAVRIPPVSAAAATALPISQLHAAAAAAAANHEKYGLERLSAMDKFPGLEKLSANMDKLGGMGPLLGIPNFGSIHGSPTVAQMNHSISPSDTPTGGFRRGMDMFRLRATDPRPCTVCGKIYKNAHTLRTHMEDKHSQCAGFRCVLCGTVAKSRNSLHSHMSRQHRGVSTRDLPLLPMPAPWDPSLAAQFIARTGGRGEVVRQQQLQLSRAAMQHSGGANSWEKSLSSSPVPSPSVQPLENGVLSASNGRSGASNGGTPGPPSVSHQYHNNHGSNGDEQTPAAAAAAAYRANLMQQLTAQQQQQRAANGGGGGAAGTGSAVLDTYLQLMAEQGLDLSMGVMPPGGLPLPARPSNGVQQDEEEEDDSGEDDEEEEEEADEGVNGVGDEPEPQRHQLNGHKDHHGSGSDRETSD